MPVLADLHPERHDGRCICATNAAVRAVLEGDPVPCEVHNHEAFLAAQTATPTDPPTGYQPADDFEAALHRAGNTRVLEINADAAAVAASYGMTARHDGGAL